MSHIVTPSALKPWPRPAPGALSLPLMPQRVTGEKNAGKEKAHTEGLPQEGKGVKTLSPIPHTPLTATGLYS